MFEIYQQLFIYVQLYTVCVCVYSAVQKIGISKMFFKEV